MRAVLKVETIRQDLGKVGPVIAAQVEEAMLGRRKALETQQAETEPNLRKMLKFERDLRQQLEKLHDQLQETKRELRLSPENIQKVVEIASMLEGQPPLQEAKVKGIGLIQLAGVKLVQYFICQPSRGVGRLCVEGLAHPHTGEIRPISLTQPSLVAAMT